ncbi:MAG: hypothetical protein K2O03_02480 [Lachnospiraceae bacterium]|nr:hypothetical protein [Lachnospiraceae bacterium]
MKVQKGNPPMRLEEVYKASQEMDMNEVEKYTNKALILAFMMLCFRVLFH